MTVQEFYNYCKANDLVDHNIWIDKLSRVVLEKKDIMPHNNKVYLVSEMESIMSKHNSRSLYDFRKNASRYKLLLSKEQVAVFKWLKDALDFECYLVPYEEEKAIEIKAEDYDGLL